ncbi:unnamed protein product [Paramecium sonneborni]|uniref:Uncharacterized protein n=1 Tax=Paramecium sonneborni TaxID=65129 RepID=A0A8S1RBK4_9CILI|nr:unnamed protein product [Paramecium sonneborni]
MQGKIQDKSFENYVNKLNRNYILRQNQIQINKYRSCNLPKQIIPNSFQSSEMLNNLEKAKFPNKSELIKARIQRGYISMNKLGEESISQKNKVVQRFNFVRFELKIPKTQRLLMRSFSNSNKAQDRRINIRQQLDSIIYNEIDNLQQ